MPSLDLVTKFILSFLDLICTIYISSYSMKKIDHYSIHVNLYKRLELESQSLLATLLKARYFPRCSFLEGELE